MRNCYLINGSFFIINKFLIRFALTKGNIDAEYSVYEVTYKCYCNNATTTPRDLLVIQKLKLLNEYYNFKMTVLLDI